MRELQERGSMVANGTAEGLDVRLRLNEVGVAVTESRCSVYEPDELPLWIASERSAVQ